MRKCNVHNLQILHTRYQFINFQINVTRFLLFTPECSNVLNLHDVDSCFCDDLIPFVDIIVGINLFFLELPKLRIGYGQILSYTDKLVNLNIRQQSKY